MRLGIHLPQYGRAASGEAVQRVARHAEELGFTDVWVSDHVVHPAAQTYPSPVLLDPLLTLGWAGSVTSRVGLGTSVLVLPQHNPLWLAKALGSLDVMSGGRVVVVAGVGWSEAEFEALGMSFHDRGARTDEIIEVLRAAWTEDPVSHEGPHYRFHEIRVLPRPARPIPIWVGGSSEAAYRRGIRTGEGFQVIGVTPEQARPVVERLRSERPEPSFTISLRTGWDPQGMEHDRIRRERDEFAAVGIEHVVAAPWRSSADDWLRSMDLLMSIVSA